MGGRGQEGVWVGVRGGGIEGLEMVGLDGGGLGWRKQAEMAQ